MSACFIGQTLPSGSRAQGALRSSPRDVDNLLEDALRGFLDAICIASEWQRIPPVLLENTRNTDGTTGPCDHACTSTSHRGRFRASECQARAKREKHLGT